MKYSKLLLLIFISFFTSCDKKQYVKIEKKQNDSTIVHSEEAFYKSKSKKIKVIDTMCIFEENRAIKDLKNGKLVYSLLYGFGTYDYSNKEMSKLLSKFSISLDSILLPCAQPPKGFRRHCYADLMNLEIEKKFGSKFIDSLRNVADKEFVKNNPNFIFDFSECDMDSRYAAAKTYEEFLEKPENDFVKKLKHTKINKFQTKKAKVNTDVFFVIYKNGTVGNIKFETDFDHSESRDFAEQFEKEAIKFVKNSKWKPAKYRGIKINSEMYLNLYNK